MIRWPANRYSYKETQRCHIKQSVSVRVMSWHSFLDSIQVILKCPQATVTPGIILNSLIPCKHGYVCAAINHPARNTSTALISIDQVPPPITTFPLTTETMMKCNNLFRKALVRTTLRIPQRRFSFALPQKYRTTVLILSARNEFLWREFGKTSLRPTLRNVDCENKLSNTSKYCRIGLEFMWRREAYLQCINMKKEHNLC